jgi:predicted nucleic-acid-binding protein
MKALDTNILVRFLVKDDERQSRAVYNAFKDAEAESKFYWVPLPVVFEIIWVLDSAYGISRREILDSLSEMLSMPILRFEAQAAIQRFIVLAQNTPIELSDVLIACAATASGCESILTFDKKASKFKPFELVEPT